MNDQRPDPELPSVTFEPSDETRNAIEVLAEDFAERMRRGERPTIGQYVASHPEYEHEILELFPTVAALEKLRVERDGSVHGRASIGLASIERLGDLRIVRELGRGGMGVVYEALQESLGRRVAVKVLPLQARWETRHLQRFEREARTAARLHHTNIVPVLGVGHQDGFHYYVMQYIEGMGLDEFIRKLKGSDAQVAHHPCAPGASYWLEVARIGLQVASALDYAHGHGTLHRDIKPGNLILDTEGTVWVADFGVARTIEQDGVTRTGDVVGTLRYMAPEQLHGEADARSDVYGLGLTLYELLTLQSAHNDAARLQSLLRGIPAGDAVPPRKLNAAIPCDLETIVLKCVAEEPERRYQTAADLAADLRRFMEDRPITARRSTPVERLWRWSRRNPAVALLSALALLLLVLVALSASVGYVHTNLALKRESEQRKRAMATLGVSLQALDRVYRRFVPANALEPAELSLEDGDEDELEPPAQPSLSKETASLLEGMLTFYDQLAALNSQDVHLRHEAARANQRVGYIHQRLGQHEPAIAAYDRAIEHYQRLVAETNNPLTMQIELASIHNDLGSVYRRSGKFREARQAHERALDLLRELTPQPQAAEWRYQLARTYYFLGDRPPRRPIPGAPRQRTDRYLDQAIDWLAGLMSEHPDVAEYRRLMALCYRERSRGNPAEVERAVAILEELVRQFPSVDDFRYDLCETYAMVDVPRSAISPERDKRWRRMSPENDVNRGRMQPEQARLAEKRLRAALEYAGPLDPQVPAFLVCQARIHHKLALILSHSARQDDSMHDDRLQEAEQCYCQALDLQAQLPEEQRQSPFVQGWRARMQWSLAELLANRGQVGDRDRAMSLLQDAAAGIEGLLKEHPNIRHLRDDLRNINTALARLRGEQSLETGSDQQT
jgi:tetratricopeptide (TPR) repeat protein